MLIIEYHCSTLLINGFMKMTGDHNKFFTISKKKNWWLHRLRICCCHCSLGPCCGTGSIPGPGTCTCRTCTAKKQNKQTNLTVAFHVLPYEVLLQLWCRLAAAAPIQPLAWEPPYATGAALKKRQKK